MRCFYTSSMAEGNNSEITEFILLGLTEHLELQALLFGIFLVIYIISVIGNLGLIMLIHISFQLHTPMYFFLSNLAFVDFCYTSSVTPNTLVNFFQEIKRISYLLVPPSCVALSCSWFVKCICSQSWRMIDTLPFATHYSIPLSWTEGSVFKWWLVHTCMAFLLDSYRQSLHSTYHFVIQINKSLLLWWCSPGWSGLP